MKTITEMSLTELNSHTISLVKLLESARARYDWKAYYEHFQLLVYANLEKNKRKISVTNTDRTA